jgi:uncharacterized membrane protein
MEIKHSEVQENINPRSGMRKLLNLFLRGLLVVLPIALTIGILFWILGLLGNVLHLNNLSFGAIILYLASGIAVIILIGKVTEGVVAQQVISFLEGVIEKAPGLSWIFGTTKDVTKAFVGKEKKFTKPVKVRITEYHWRFGFLTQEDLADVGLPQHCTVYLPMSYAITGELIVAKKIDVEPLDVDSGALMKFIVSGGVTEIK